MRPDSRTLGIVLGGVAVRIAGAGVALYMASLAWGVLGNALAQVSAALPH